MKVVIAVPSLGVVRAETMGSVLTLGIGLERGGIPFRVAQCHSSDIVDSRNRLCADFLGQGDATHLLFVDADMGFGLEAVQRLIDLKRPVVGAIYPRRQADLGEIVRLARAHPELSTESVVSRALDHVYFTGSFESEPEPAGRIGDFFRVSGIGMGLTLIERHVLETMVERGAVDLVHSGEGPAHHDFFGVIISDDGQRRFSEDLSFCRRWALECGGEIWADGAAPVSHIGPAAFHGMLVESDRAGEDASAAGMDD